MAVVFESQPFKRANHLDRSTELTVIREKTTMARDPHPCIPHYIIHPL